MTIRKLSTQLFSLSVGGYFNHQKVSARWLHNYISTMFRVGGDSLIMEIALPDGWWYFTIYKYGGGYDYVIPDTREQECRVKSKLNGGFQHEKV